MSEQEKRSIEEEHEKSDKTPTKPLPLVARKISDLSPEEYAQLQLNIARQQRLEEQAEEEARREDEARLEEERREAEKLPPYNFRFTFMSMFTVSNLIGELLILGFTAWFVYVIVQQAAGVNTINPGTRMPSGAVAMYVFLAVLGLIWALLNLVRIWVHFRKDRLEVKDGSLVYTPPKVLWLLMFGGEKSSKQILLRQAATGSFQQNPIESMFRMDSTSFILDTAGEEAKVFKKLRGVSHIELLKAHIAEAR